MAPLLAMSSVVQPRVACLQPGDQVPARLTAPPPVPVSGGPHLRAVGLGSARGLGSASRRALPALQAATGADDSNARKATTAPTLAAACTPSAGIAGEEGVQEVSTLEEKTYDAVALSNLCVDVVLSVDKLPPPDDETRMKLLEDLAASSISEETWEVGGSANFLISAARLGMGVASIGHLNDDRFGNFMDRVLKEESIQLIERVPMAKSVDPGASHTLLCFVLVDSNGKHAFCSRYDFGPWPLLGHLSELPESAMKLLRDTRAVYVNGFCFDELRPKVVIEAVKAAAEAGAAVFFDPGPRCWTLLEGERRLAMEGVLDYASGVLVTLEEGGAITGQGTSTGVANCFLDRPGSKRMEWVVVKDGPKGAMLVNRHDVHTSPGFQVEVEDTVGCGDSFAAAIVLGYINGSDISAALRLANAVGAATATRRGAGRNVGDPATVRLLLESEAGCQKALSMIKPHGGNRVTNR